MFIPKPAALVSEGGFQTVVIGIQPFSLTVSYVCMYLLIGKGQNAQKDHIGAKIE